MRVLLVPLLLAYLTFFFALTYYLGNQPWRRWWWSGAMLLALVGLAWIVQIMLATHRELDWCHRPEVKVREYEAIQVAASEVTLLAHSPIFPRESTTTGSESFASTQTSNVLQCWFERQHRIQPCKVNHYSLHWESKVVHAGWSDTVTREQWVLLHQEKVVRRLTNYRWGKSSWLGVSAHPYHQFLSCLDRQQQQVVAFVEVVDGSAPADAP